MFEIFGKKTGEIDYLFKQLERGGASESVLQYLGDHFDDEVKRLLLLWVNADMSVIPADAGIISAHEMFRQRIKSLLLLKQNLVMNRQEGKAAQEVLDSMNLNKNQLQKTGSAEGGS